MIIKKILTFVTAIILTNFLSAVIALNDHEPVFPDPDSDDIKSLVIDGSSYFLSSYSDALKLLNNYEKASKGSFNFEESKSNTTSAFQKLVFSKNKYQKALELGRDAGYVKFFRDKLVGFNYDLIVEEKSLNRIIANEVIGYLQKGDVIGIYQKNIDNIDEIILVIEKIDENLKGGIQPEVELLWDLLHKYSKALLFGNYSTVMAKKAFKNQ